MMKCTRCGVETDVFYNVNEGLVLCSDCATLSVSQLSFEGLLEMSETEVLEADGDVVAVNDEAVDFGEIERSLNQIAVVENSEEKFYCTYYQKNVTDSAGAACDVDAGENPDENGVFDSGRVYPSFTCDNCRYRVDEEENYES